MIEMALLFDMYISYLSGIKTLRYRSTLTQSRVEQLKQHTNTVLHQNIIHSKGVTVIRGFNLMMRLAISIIPAIKSALAIPKRKSFVDVRKRGNLKRSNITRPFPPRVVTIKAKPEMEIIN